MKVVRFPVSPIPQQEQVPFARISNIGCGLSGCGCSAERFITLSDGEMGLTVSLTEQEWGELGLPSQQVFATLRFQRGEGHEVPVVPDIKTKEET